MVQKRKVEISDRAFGAGGAKDTSDDLTKMGIYEKGILTIESMEALAELPVLTKENAKDYEYVVYDKNDFTGMTAASMGSAGHDVNSEFLALEIPYRAKPFAEKAEKTANKKDATKTSKKSNVVLVYRTGEEFDINLYAGQGSNKVSTNANSENFGKPLMHERYTEGQKKRAAKWVAEVFEELDDETIAAVGLDRLGKQLGLIEE